MTLYAYGWCVIRSSRECYVGASLDETIDRIDETVDRADTELADKLVEWLGDPEDRGDFMWSLKPQAWSEAKVLLYTASRNHRPSRLWMFHDWVTTNAPGSYGLTYVHDDEDLGDPKWHGRAGSDYSNVFRVFRIANGHLDELDDPFLSPLVPTINPNENC